MVMMMMMMMMRRRRRRVSEEKKCDEGRRGGREGKGNVGGFVGTRGASEREKREKGERNGNGPLRVQSGGRQGGGRQPAAGQEGAGPPAPPPPPDPPAPPPPPPPNTVRRMNVPSHTILGGSLQSLLEKKAGALMLMLMSRAANRINQPAKLLHATHNAVAGKSPMSSVYSTPPHSVACNAISDLVIENRERERGSPV